MKEEYLHYIWKTKRFDFRALQLEDGRKITIRNNGWHNFDAGPDFFNGTIAIDGIEWSGNIELHLKSSDWYLHRHHLDPAYDNVVLHVVLEHDREVIVNNRKLPTLTLKDRIDKQHYHQFSRLLESKCKLPCESELGEQQEALNTQITNSFLERMERKGLELMSVYERVGKNRNTTMLAALCQSLGGRVNKLPFLELAQRIDPVIVERERWNITRLSALFFGVAGLLNVNYSHPYVTRMQRDWMHMKRKYNLQEMQTASWKFSGVRPYSFPTLKIAQLIAILHHVNVFHVRLKTAADAKMLTKKLRKLELHSFWENHFTLERPCERPHAIKLSQNTIRSIIVNAVAPLYVFFKHLEQDYSFEQALLELMIDTPPEQNTIIKQWKKRGVTIENALESQGILELNNEFCTFKKCLSCEVGRKLLA
ncbi:MAG: DUF2851 family protein [Bacteroidota bacterium]